MHYYDGPTAGLLADTPGRYQLNLHVRLADRDPEGFRVRQAQAPLSIEVERNIDTEPVSCTF